MFFLCTPISFDEAGIRGWGIVWLVIILFCMLIYPFFYGLFTVCYRKGKLAYATIKRVMYESFFYIGILGAIPLAAPSSIFLCNFGLILPILAMFMFPIYFTFSFINILFSKGIYEPFERKLLLFYYSIPTFLILSLGIASKTALYGSVSDLIFYYSTENLAFFSFVLIFLLFLFWIYYSFFGTMNR
ncbi:MAG: hypothetical protein RMJ36_00655 [Candidatus Calescibacterium sp.]|nr:hypothetical protein [Candidatus Calescibacterium sp.]MDW8132154.1 hypothetical protein [Candidatus Calescibacterium sp.]